MARKLHFLYMFFIFLIAAKGSATSLLKISDKNTVYDLTAYTEILSLSDHKTSLYHIVTGNIDGAFKPLKNYKTDSSHLHWLKVSIVNTSSADKTWIFGLGDSNEEITMYMVDSTGIAGYKKSGTNIPLAFKEIKVGRSEFSSFYIKQGIPYTFYIKIANRNAFSKQFLTYSLHSFRLYSQESFTLNFENTKALNIFFYGAILTMLFYNLILAINLQSKSYMYYVIYVFFFFLFFALVDGVFSEWFFYNSALQNHKMRILVAPVMAIAYLQFSKTFLRTKTYAPKSDKIIVGIMLVLAASYVPMFLDYWIPGRNLLLMAITTGTLYMLFLSVVIYRRGYRPSMFFIIANLLLILTSITFMIYLTGIIPNTPLTRFIEYGPQVASVFELCIFSLGLGDRIKITEKYIMEDQLKREIDKQQLVEEKNEELETKVKQRTDELLIQKEKLAILNQDLTQKVKERTKKLQKAYRDLLNLNYELDSFIYRAAHDIRGPITTIMGLCNLALMEKDAQKTREYLTILDTYSKKTQVTLNRILSVNEIKNNHIKPSYFTIDLLKQNLMALLEENPNRHKVNITFSIPDDQYLYSDQALLELIIINMIENSIRFRINEGREKPFCKVDFFREETGMRITIADNGNGIEESIKERIFDMFFRGSEYASGSGLGLYIAKIASKKLNGDIYLMSNQRGATAFELFFPYLKERNRFELHK